jgi:hypothetical protein
MVTRDDEDHVIGCFPQAFELRPGEHYLSASWLEYFDGVDTACLAGIVRAISETRTIRPRHGLAVGLVSKIKEACSDFGSRVRIVSEPKKGNPSYTTVRGYRSDEIELLELLAQDAWSQVYEAGPSLSYVGPCRPRP